MYSDEFSLSFSIFFQSFDIWPILVRVDYSPCRVDLAALRGGKYVELVNLVPWKVTICLFDVLIWSLHVKLSLFQKRKKNIFF